MPFSVRFDGEIYWTSLQGRFTNADLIELSKTAAELEATHAVIPNRIVDFSTVEQFDVDFEGFEAFAKVRMGRRFRNDFKSAFIAPGSAQYGFARMYQTLVAHSQIHVAIFPAVEAAMPWLAAPGVDVPATQWGPPAISPSESP